MKVIYVFAKPGFKAGRIFVWGEDTTEGARRALDKVNSLYTETRIQVDKYLLQDLQNIEGPYIL